MVRRNYFVEAKDLDFNLESSMSFAFVGYEVPILGLIYVQLGERLWMNAAAGVSVDFYPSNVFKLVSDSQDSIIYDFEQHTFRKRWVSMGVLANYGFEYRTKDKGYFYIGASYHRPFDAIAVTEATYYRSNKPVTVENDLSGIYLTLDLRYFFHEDPDKKKKLKKSP
jgi:hypothetical protein